MRTESACQLQLKERIEFRQVIVITGTPGVGKTTVSEQLAARLGALHINLTCLVKREKLTSGYDKRRRTTIADANKLTKRLQGIIRQKGNLVIDGHYAPTVTPKGQITGVFVLRRHPQQLKEELEKRGFKGPKLWENLAAEVLDLCLYDSIMNAGNEKVCEIDTTNKTVECVVNEIISILNGTRPCTVGITDWLGTLEKEGDLDKYMKHF